jgi:hypothetical protein
MSLYTRLRNTANRMLKGKGQTITLKKQTPGAYNVSTGAATVTETTQNAWGAVFDYGAKQIDGTLITAKDKNLLLSAFTTAGALLTAPVLNDKVVIGGVTYTIKEPLKTIAPGGTTVIYDCNIRV